MGVDSQEMLAHQLGHMKQKKFMPTINAGAEPEAAPLAASFSQIASSPVPPAVAKKLTPDEEFAQVQEAKRNLSMAQEGLNSRYSDMYKAFQFVDLDRSGRLSKKEIARALDLWNVPMSSQQLDTLLAACDQDGDGGISYEEFVDKLGRDTVAPAAMGKRGLQSLQAMGVDSQEMLAHQLGHMKQKKFMPTINTDY